MRKPPSLRRGERGFTLVEAVMVIVIIGILGAIVAVFIRAPIEGYADMVARAEASDQADLALRRMARDIRLALPNSVRVSAAGDAIEFLQTTTGGRYLSTDDSPSSGFPLEFEKLNNPDNPGSKKFTVVGGLAGPVAAGDYIVVYNLGPGMAPADAYQFGKVDSNIAQVEAAAGLDAPEIVLVANPFIAQTSPMPSPARRFQVVSGPVSFRCESVGGQLTLRRYSGYPIAAAMPAAPGGKVAVLARRITSCANTFRYDEAANPELRRSALVILSLTLHTRSAADPADRPVRLVHQVHVDNAP